MKDGTIGSRGNGWRLLLWGGAAALLLAPLIAMQFTSEVAWTRSDFVIMGVMLATVCGGIELAVRMSRHHAARAAAGVALVTAFLLTWMNLAVGVIGNENNPLNLMFFGVIAVGFAGALLARLRPGGMAVAMAATALAQTLVAVVAQAYGHFTWVLTAVFVALWLGSAWLFRKAARDQAAA
ncbi:MAG: hypothetical protein Q7U20_02295 [Caulobacter sp.]|nr:hypothetical protein [Caulobacter sp.]